MGTSTIRTRRLLRKRFWLGLTAVSLLLSVHNEGLAGSDRGDFIARQAVGGHGFHLLAWEIQALDQKAADWITRPGEQLNDTERHSLVVSYFDLLAREKSLKDDIQRLYADPTEGEPSSAAAPLENELASRRLELQNKRPTVERILQQQVGMAIGEAGLANPGLVWPPVLFQFTESPDVLVISPRDRIVYRAGSFLGPGISTSDMEEIERQIETQPNVSALVERTGGFSAYPTMVLETTDLRWALGTIAHEWVHTYLVFHPLGWHYFDNGDTRTLNETVASIAGDELGDLVLARYYPEKVPAPSRSARTGGGMGGLAMPQFDFGATMRETRLRVDSLLESGRIEEAESYMEQQRQLVVSHGYLLRRINQAYFAFHGSYAVGPAATDPIGEKLRILRTRSTTLREFVQAVRTMTTVADLEKIVSAAQ